MDKNLLITQVAIIAVSAIWIVLTIFTKITELRKPRSNLKYQSLNNQTTNNMSFITVNTPSGTALISSNEIECVITKDKSTSGAAQIFTAHHKDCMSLIRMRNYSIETTQTVDEIKYLIETANPIGLRRVFKQVDKDK